MEPGGERWRVATSRTVTPSILLSAEKRRRRAGACLGQPAWMLREHERLREVWLSMEHEAGSPVDIGLLRPLEWLKEEGAAFGEWLWREMPERGCVGHAQVKEIRRSGPLPPEGIPIVTGWFRHGRARTLDLWVEGEEEVLGVTPTHPFWSVDRADWLRATCVPARGSVGETVPSGCCHWAGLSMKCQSTTSRWMVTTATESGSRGCWCTISQRGIQTKRCRVHAPSLLRSLEARLPLCEHDGSRIPTISG